MTKRWPVLSFVALFLALLVLLPATSTFCLMGKAGGGITEPAPPGARFEEPPCCSEACMFGGIVQLPSFEPSQAPGKLASPAKALASLDLMQAGRWSLGASNPSQKDDPPDGSPFPSLSSSRKLSALRIFLI